VLVFGAGAVQALESGVGAQAHVSILLAMLLPALFFSPWACSAGLRIALE
jgi:heme exporter protein B